MTRDDGLHGYDSPVRSSGSIRNNEVYDESKSTPKIAGFNCKRARDTASF